MYRVSTIKIIAIISSSDIYYFIEIQNGIHCKLIARLARCYVSNSMFRAILIEIS